jgi:arabinogalactan endo-1,4-beta-galactosidase
MNKQKFWDYLKKFIDIIQSLAIIGGIIFGILQLYFLQIQTKIQSDALIASNIIASANYVLDLSKQLDSPKYSELINAISSNNINYPILKNDGGKFTEGKVENLLGIYETIGDLYEENLISKKMAYNEFSDDIEATFCNNSIQKYIKKIREEDGILEGDRAFFQDLKKWQKIS